MLPKSTSIGNSTIRALRLHDTAAKISQAWKMYPSHYSGNILTIYPYIGGSKVCDIFKSEWLGISDISIWYLKFAMIDIYWEYTQKTVPSKTCNTPYISETALTFLNLIRKILPPQHIVVNPFSDYPTACQPYVHDGWTAHPPKIFNTAKRKLVFLPGKSNAHFI